MKILVLGKNGQLASELYDLAPSYATFNFVFLGSAECDITNDFQLRSCLKQVKPDVVINCAAYTLVDQAEDEPERAFAVNYQGVLNLNRAAEEGGFRYIHISTDYVFDGEAIKPYRTDSITNPIGIYGLSKRRGEEVVLSSSADAIIMRTSWVFSSHGKNFVKTMLHLGRNRSEMNVVDDQIGSPTYAKDLAKVCLEIIKKTKVLSSYSRVYHFTNSGTCTWYAFARKIFEEAGISCKINPISSEQYPTKAKRPHYSVLDCSAIQNDFDIKIPTWEDALRRCLQVME